MNYIFTIDERIDDNFMDIFSSLMPQTRRVFYQLCQDRLRKKQTVVSYLLLCYALYDQYGINNLKLDFTYNSNGKPSLSEYPKIYFNISHSANYIMCSISDREVGCDIQELLAYDVRDFSRKESLFKLGAASEENVETVTLRTDNYVLSISQYNNVDKGLVKVSCDTLLSFFETRSSLFAYYKLNCNQDKLTNLKTPLQRFFECAEQNPDKLAVVYHNNSITYQELDKCSSAFAHRLKNVGVKRGDAVILSIPPSLEFSIAQWAIVKCGAYYVPLYNRWPVERVNFIVKDSQAKVMVVDKSAQFADCTIEHIIVCENCNLTNDFKFEDSSSLDDVFYMIYTSGSTGVPKGVKVSNKNVAAFSNTINGGYYDTIVKKPSNVACICPVSFDMSVGENTTTLLNGGTVCFADSEEQLPDRFADFIITNKIEVVWCTPSKFKMYLKTPGCMDALNTLKSVVLAGETLDRETAELALKFKFALYNTYAPTETTIISTYYHVVKIEDNIPIGVPFSGESCFVISEEGELCDVEEKGELLIGGCGVALGYKNNAVLTANKFIDNPFGEGRLYKTGDIVALDKEGYLRFYGRKDNQLKVNGFRVELEEIEEAIYSNTSMKAIVLYYKGNLIAVMERGVSEPVLYLLKTKLPDYMIPTIYYQIETFPLNANGKIDRKRIEDFVKAQVSHAVYKAPENELQKLFVRAWEEILTHRPIGIDDSFHLIGGNSIDAMRISGVLREHGVNVMPFDILNGKTIRAITNKLEHSNEKKIILRKYYFCKEDCASDSEDFDEEAIKKYADNFTVMPPRIEYSPLNFHQNIIDSTQSLNVCTYKIEGTQNINSAKLALRNMIRKNAAFRTLFHTPTEMLHQFEYYDNWYIPLVDIKKINKAFESCLFGFSVNEYRHLSFCFIVVDGRGDLYFVIALHWAFTDHLAEQIVYDQLTDSLNTKNQNTEIMAKGPYEFTQLVHKHRFSFLKKSTIAVIEELKKFTFYSGNPALKEYLSNCECNHFECIVKPDAALKQRLSISPIDFLVNILATVLRKDSNIMEIPIYILEQNRNFTNDNIVLSVIDFVPILTTPEEREYYSKFKDVLLAREPGDWLIENQTWNKSNCSLPFVNFIPTMSKDSELVENKVLSHLILQKDKLDKTPKKQISLSAFFDSGDLVLAFDVPMAYKNFKEVIDHIFETIRKTEK